MKPLSPKLSALKPTDSDRTMLRAMGAAEWPTEQEYNDPLGLEVVELSRRGNKERHEQRLKAQEDK